MCPARACLCWPPLPPPLALTCMLSPAACCARRPFILSPTPLHAHPPSHTTPSPQCTHTWTNACAAAGPPGAGSWDADEDVVWSGHEVPYLVTYNKVRTPKNKWLGARAHMGAVLLQRRQRTWRAGGWTRERWPQALPTLCPPSLQRQQRLAIWGVCTQQGQGFVAVTPMRWPGTPATPGASSGAFGGPASLTPGMLQTPPASRPPATLAGTTLGTHAAGGGATYKK